MKQLFTITTAIAIIIFSASVNAQSKKTSAKGVRWSIGAEAGVPVGKFNTPVQWNLGGSIQADFNVAKRVLFITANTGFNNFFTESGVKGDVQMIPVKAGLKYFPAKNFYIQGEAGVSFLTSKDKNQADRSASFVYAPQLGYLIPLGKRNYLDAGIRFESNSKFYDNGSQANFFGLRVAYAFNSK
ncbi:outer membrane beta-barrel protein [Lacibacter sp. H375]|uniref:outer membrane beta-barrel protein n=1 Tax=Lacibacter sp. H375 TaxID=3133424 RepID=UPI0030C261EE